MKLNTLSLPLAALCLPIGLLAQAPFDIALIGDTPYGVAAEPRFERVIADINRQNVEFTVHIGDTKSGSTRCDDSHYTRVLNWFNSFQKPLLYSVGDNEWTDCMRTNNGAYNPLDRLAMVRKTLFATNMSLGQRPIPLIKQSADPKYALYVENSMLVKAPVVFATIHVPGSNNNLEYKLNQGPANPFYDQDKEFQARNAANIVWLRQAFKTAKDTKSLGLMIFIQANVFEAFFEEVVGSTRSGYEEFVSVLRSETKAFAGEVVLVSGDTHYMRVDKPLTDLYPACTAATGPCKPFEAALDARGARVLNFTRVEVPGSADVHWALCHIRPNERNLFQFEFMIMPAAAVTAGPSAVVTQPGSTTAVTTVDSNGLLTLDGSQSNTTNGGDLSYSWSSAQGYPVAGLTRGDTATPTFQFVLRGTYQVALTVTDRTGATSTSAVTVRYQ